MPRKSSSSKPDSSVDSAPDNPIDQPSVDPAPDQETDKKPYSVWDDPDKTPATTPSKSADNWDGWDGADFSGADKKPDPQKPPAVDWSQIDPFQAQNPDTVGNQRYQPQMPDMNLRHDSTSYNKRDNLINHTRTSIKQEDPDGNKWKTEVDTRRQRNWYNNLL